MRFRGWSIASVAVAIVLSIAASGAARAEWPVPPAGGGMLILAGHAGDVMVTMRRFPLRVTAIGSPDENGNVWSFEVDMADLEPNELRSWRVTFVSGELFAYVFQVRENVGTTVTVTSLDGPLNGIAVGDGMLVEQVQMQRPAPQMRNPPLAGA
ncbi:MAG: hypothetical protein KIS68_02830 [Bauldia sp.]|nr:hypothetical protein [Bauldia sp.]